MVSLVYRAVSLISDRAVRRWTTALVNATVRKLGISHALQLEATGLARGNGVERTQFMRIFFAGIFIFGPILGLAKRLLLGPNQHNLTVLLWLL